MTLRTRNQEMRGEGTNACQHKTWMVPASLQEERGTSWHVMDARSGDAPTCHQACAGTWAGQFEKLYWNYTYFFPYAKLWLNSVSPWFKMMSRERYDVYEVCKIPLRQNPTSRRDYLKENLNLLEEEWQGQKQELGVFKINKGNY